MYRFVPTYLRKNIETQSDEVGMHYPGLSVTGGPLSQESAECITVTLVLFNTKLVNPQALPPFSDRRFRLYYLHPPMSTTTTITPQEIQAWDLDLINSPVYRYVNGGSFYFPRLIRLPIIGMSYSDCFNALYLGPE
jgi:hypothetical protein